jgi:hypothetical protein
MVLLLHGLTRSLLVVALIGVLSGHGVAFAQPEGGEYAESEEEYEEYDDLEELEEVDEPEAAPNLGQKVLDVGLLRPLSFTQMLVGGVLLVPTGSLALIGGMENFRATADVWVGQPYRDTFEMPIGEF